MITYARLLTVVAASLLAAAPAGAQAFTGGTDLSRIRAAAHRTIALGREINDSLTARDATLRDNSHFHTWRFSAQAGDEIVATLTSSDFDAYLMVVALAGDSAQLIDSEIDAGSGARTAIGLPATGEYLLVANTVAGEEIGAYTLSLRSLADACAAGGPCRAAAREITPAVTDPIAAAAASPAVQSIALGGMAEGELTNSDPRMPDSSHFALWRYQGSAGERVVIDHSSADFDAYLMLALLTADGVRRLSSDDDGGEGTDSQLAVELPETGMYIIVANTFAPDETGRYRITVRPLEEACASGGPCILTAEATRRRNPLAAAAEADTRDLTFGQAVEARLTDDDEMLESGNHFHAYRFEGRAGEEIAVHQTSSDFDAYLYLARRTEEDVELVARDDDSGGGRNALLTARLPHTGEYLVLASGFSSSDTGHYALTLNRMQEACASLGVCEIGASLARITENRAVLTAPARPIAQGDRVSGELTDEANTLPRGRPFQAWRYTGRAGEQLVITQRSSDFDSYLYLYRTRGSAVEEIATNDDGAGSLDAELNVELEESGDYLILAAGYGSSARGEYELTVQSLADACSAGGPCAPGESSAAIARLQPALAAEQRSLAPGRAETGELREDTPTMPGRGRFDAYRFSGTADERVVLTMNSDDFDTYLYLTQLRDGRLRLVDTDDDGGPGTNARLVTTLPESGEYVVIAAAFGTSGVGAYTLALDWCDDACAAAAVSVGSSPSSGPVWELALEAERRALPPSGHVEGELGSGDPTLGDGKYFHAYWFEAAAGATIRAALNAEFDAYLNLLRLEGDSLVRVAYDDDGGEGTNALLQWTADAPGTYVIIATSFWRDTTGSYTLQVEFASTGTARPRQEAAAP